MSSIKELSKKIDLIKKQEKNKKCFDCGEKGTTYVCLDFGTFICSRCAGLLRDLNYRVKGTSVSIFNQREIEIIEKNGNEIAQKIWMAKYRKDKDKEPNSKDDDSLKIFLSIKYKDKRWYKKPKHTIKIENLKNNNKNEKEKSDDEEENGSESESEEENKKKEHKKVMMNSKKDESDNDRNDSDEESYDGENKKNIKEKKENKKTNEDNENSSSDEEKKEQVEDNSKKAENQNDIKKQKKVKSNFKLKKPTTHNTQNNKKIKKNSKSKKEEKRPKEKKKNKREEKEEKNDKQEEDEFYLAGESQDNNNCNKKNKDEKPIQSIENNYYLLDIFSTPYNPGNQNTFVNNMNTFNITQGANQLQQQKNNNHIFQGYDFTNVNIPENKERIEQQKRFDKLENALNNLIISNQYKNMNMNSTNLGYNMVDGMYYNPKKIMYNNNYIPINNYNYMNNMNNHMNANMNNMNNNFVPFDDLNFVKDNQLNTDIKNPQYKPTNNPFCFI